MTAAFAAIVLLIVFLAGLYLMTRPAATAFQIVTGAIAAVASAILLMVAAVPAVLAADTAASAAAAPAPSVSEIVGLAAAGVLTLLGLLVRRLIKAGVAYLETRTGLALDAHTRDYLDAALDRAVDFGLAKAAEALGHDAPPAELRAHALHVAAGYAQERVPDALARFNVGTPALADMLAARLATVPALLDPQA